MNNDGSGTGIFEMSDELLAALTSGAGNNEPEPPVITNSQSAKDADAFCEPRGGARDGGIEIVSKGNVRPPDDDWTGGGKTTTTGTTSGGTDS